MKAIEELRNILEKAEATAPACGTLCAVDVPVDLVRKIISGQLERTPIKIGDLVNVLEYPNDVTFQFMFNGKTSLTVRGDSPFIEPFKDYIIASISFDVNRAFIWVQGYEEKK